MHSPWLNNAVLRIPKTLASTLRKCKSRWLNSLRHSTTQNSLMFIDYQAMSYKNLTHQHQRKLQYTTMHWQMLTQRQLFHREPLLPECLVEKTTRKNRKTSWTRQSCWQKLGHCRDPCLTLTTTLWTGQMTAAKKKLNVNAIKLLPITLHNSWTILNPFNKSGAPWQLSTCLSALIASMAERSLKQNCMHLILTI